LRDSKNEKIWVLINSKRAEQELSEEERKYNGELYLANRLRTLNLAWVNREVKSIE